MKDLQYQCPKCKNHDYEVSEIRTAGGFLSKIFDVQNIRFSSVTCTRCKYTELFRAETNMLGNIFDFFTN